MFKYHQYEFNFMSINKSEYDTASKWVSERVYANKYNGRSVGWLVGSLVWFYLFFFCIKLSKPIHRSYIDFYDNFR